MKFKLTLFVAANRDLGEEEQRFPRLRLCLLLKHLHNHPDLGTTIAMVDDRWPIGIREDLAWHDDGYTQGIRFNVICDDAGIGRITRVAHKHPSAGIEIEDIEDFTNPGLPTFWL